MKLTQLFVVFFLLLALPSFAVTQQEDGNAAGGAKTSVANPQAAAPAAESGKNQTQPTPGNSKSDDDRSKQVLSLFTWFTDVESPDWVTGVIYALLGLVGALITVFGLIGGAIPGTAGFARIEAGMKRVEEREKILDKLIKDAKRNPEEIKAVEVATNNLRDDLREDRRRQFGLAAGLYAILGAFFATMLARDLLQAILIGAGWTAYLGALGLKKDYAQRKTIKDDTTEKLETAVAQAKKGALTDKDFEELQVVTQVSKAL